MRISIFTAHAQIAALALCLVSFTASAIPYSDNVYLHGTLVTEPCTLSPGDVNVIVGFGDIEDQYLYINGRSPSQPFQLHLQGCDLNVVTLVGISFSGSESSVLPGLLAVMPNNSGIAVGIEDAWGQAITLNNGNKYIMLENGDNTLNFAAWIQGEPQAIKEHSITGGKFSAVATFQLSYY